MTTQLGRDFKLATSPLSEVSQFLSQRSIQSYLVGGYVRDLLLGRVTADIDIAVAASALEVAREAATVLGGKYVLLDEAHQVARVVLTDEAAPQGGKWYLDFSTLQGTIEQDLARRDFTIDAMALGLTLQGEDGLQLIDPFAGRQDLERRLIRAVSRDVFQQDAIRLLRAMRLAAWLGFLIEGATESLVRRHSHLVAEVAGEKVRSELLCLLSIPGSACFLHHLDELGLLTALIPELEETKGAEQPKEHFWDGFNHSLETVAAIEFLLREGDWQYVRDDILSVVPWSTELAQHFDQEVSSGSSRRSLLKLAGMLHDIAKPQTKSVNEKGRTHFFGHAKIGAAIAVRILERLRFSNREVNLVEITVTHHLRPMQMSDGEMPSRRAIYRYFRDTGEAGIDCQFLSLADHLATRGPYLDLAQWQQHAQMAEYVLSQRFKEEGVVHPPRLIDGHDLIDIFGLSPGPRIGWLLEAVREAQAAGELANREEALAFVRERLSSEGM